MDMHQSQPDPSQNQPTPKSQIQLTDAQAVKFFVENLAELQTSGLPLLRSLMVVEKLAYHSGLEAALKDVGVAVENGDSLSEAMSKHKIFEPMVVKTVTAGEVGGVLDLALARLSEALQKREAFAKAPVPFHTTADARLFALQLGLLIGVGVPILESINIAGEGTSPEMRALVKKIHDGIRAGHSFCGSITEAKGEGLVGPVFMAILDVGEETGELDKALVRFADRT